MPDPAEREADIRFSLANERTLLAYQRTAIGLIAAAVAFAHLLNGDSLAFVLALVLLVAGAIAALGGYQRFRAAEKAIREGRSLHDSAAPHLLTITVVLAVAVAAAYILVRAS